MTADDSQENGGGAATPINGGQDDSQEVLRHQTDAQIKAIESEIRENQPLTSMPLPVVHLVDLYAEGGAFQRGAQYLAEKYTTMRKVRGDGNCYYRAFLYSVCEKVLRGVLTGDDGAKKELERLTALAKGSMDKVEAQGYDRSAIEMFHEELVDLFVYMAGTETQSASLDGLHKLLTEENATSEYCTWYLRVVTAAYLKADADRFVHFLDGDYFDMSTFCSREVEPMNKECGMVQVLALAEAMDVDVTIEYLDGRDFPKDGGLARHEFGPRSMGQQDAGTSITLLYRPGHYDILY